MIEYVDLPLCMFVVTNLLVWFFVLTKCTVSRLIFSSVYKHANLMFVQDAESKDKDGLYAMMDTMQVNMRRLCRGFLSSLCIHTIKVVILCF